MNVYTCDKKGKMNPLYLYLITILYISLQIYEKYLKKQNNLGFLLSNVCIFREKERVLSNV